METLSQVHTPHSYIDTEKQDYDYADLLAQSSNESTSFSNQFEQKDLPNMKEILEIDADYFKEVNALDVENVQNEGDKALEVIDKNLNIDPDDDMAGIMLELQKDREEQTEEQE